MIPERRKAYSVSFQPNLSQPGTFVPTAPWPQVLYVTGSMWRAVDDKVEIRPLTVTGLVRGVTRNFVRMNYWRFMLRLRILGFLATPEMQTMSWRHFTPRFWRHQMWWRLRSVRIARRLITRFRGGTN